MPKEHKPKSPAAGPTPALPASVEESYRQKCKEIKKRISEIENSNDLLTSRIQRARRAIQRMRLERAFLLEQLEKRTDARVDDSEGSPSPPPTPSQKPLRVKRPRKDVAPSDTPMRHASESPHPRDAMRESLRQDPHEYPFVNQSFVSAGDHNSSPYMLPNSGGKAPKGAGTTRSYGYRARGGPKRPPNAYMIFCERERDAVRERESMKENFDMHKALAQAWRDLKHEGQKPYFDEYEKNKASYTAKVNELRDFHGGQQQEPSSAGGGGKRAASQGSAPGSPVGAGTSADEEGEDHVMAGGDYGFTSVNRN